MLTIVLTESKAYGLKCETTVVLFIPVILLSILCLMVSTNCFHDKKLSKTNFVTLKIQPYFAIEQCANQVVKLRHI